MPFYSSLDFKKLKEDLGKNWKEILIWSIGSDWEILSAHLWPERIKRNTGIKVEIDDIVYTTFLKVKQKWQHIQEGKK